MGMRETDVRRLKHTELTKLRKRGVSAVQGWTTGDLGGKSAWNTKINSVWLACPLSTWRMGYLGCSKARRTPAQVDSQDAGMDL